MLKTLMKSENMVFLSFTVLLFSFPKGYVVGAILLLIVSLYFVFLKQFKWHKNLSLYMLSVAILFIPYIVNLLQDTTQLRELDNISRLLFFGVIGSSWLVKKPDFNIVTTGFCLSLLIIFIWFVSAQVTGLNRGIGLVGLNVIPLTTSIVAIIAFLLPMLDNSNSISRKFIYIVFVLGVSSVVISQTKGALLAVVCILIIYSLYIIKHSWKRVFGLWLLMLCAIFITSELTNSGLLSRINTLSSNISTYKSQKQDFKFDNSVPNEIRAVGAIESSSTIRIELWKSSVLLSQEKPWFGYGYDKAKERVVEFAELGKIEAFIAPMMGKNYHFHSIYFDSLAKRGIAGLISTLIFLLIPIYIFMNNRHLAPEYALSGCLVVVSFMVSGLSDMSLFSRMPIILFGILVMLCIVNVTELEANDKAYKTL